MSVLKSSISLVSTLTSLLVGATAFGAADPQTRLSAAIEWLNKSPTGKASFELANQKNIPIREGHVSKTEMTATRIIDGRRESMQYSTQVLIARSKEPIFQALDLAHELTHATHPNTNPFDPNLNAETYVQKGIEGDGGEAQAILQECKVGRELLGFLKDETRELVKARCQYVWKTESDDQKWKRSFYQLGQYYHDFMDMIANIKMDSQSKMEWAKKVEERSPLFASAVTHKPYPVALLEEYIKITQKICEKTTASVARITQNRGIASAVSGLASRCQSVKNIP